jgi:aerobic-type carbon monoxide dehydrogenase small subunit (CoxS/CutS family)
VSNEENRLEVPPENGGWQPIPHGEYDADATAFVQLPPEGALDMAPLEAPGHGYVPPMITPLTPADVTDPAATAAWAAHRTAGEPAEVRWPEPASASEQGEPQADSHATGQWTFPGHGDGTAYGNTYGNGTVYGNGPAYGDEAGAGSGAEPVQAASELTGQWTIPVANGDLPDESGEFTTSALKSQWDAAAPSATPPGGTPAPWVPSPDAPATLPGGAAAPWAMAAEPAAADEEPATQPVQESVQESQSDSEEAAEAGAAPAPEEGTHGASEAVEPAEPAQEEAAALSSSTGSNEHPPTSYVLRVNGTDRPVTDAWIGESLLYVLRERLGLAGAKDGCSQGECGACNVQVDGRLVASCLVPAATAAGSEVRTVEGLATDGEPSDVQHALADCGAVQCGFCIPGMAMTIHDLLEGNHAPTELQTRQALCGNLCRCSGYRGVLDAVREVVAGRGVSASAAAEASEEVWIPHQAPPGAGSVQPHPHDGGMA